MEYSETGWRVAWEVMRGEAEGKRRREREKTAVEEGRAVLAELDSEASIGMDGKGEDTSERKG